MAHTGREAEAEAAARRLIDHFERADVDAIAINAAGCGSHMKEFGHLLRDDPGVCGTRPSLYREVPRHLRTCRRAGSSRGAESCAHDRRLP